MTFSRLRSVVSFALALGIGALAPGSALGLRYDATDPASTGCSAGAFTWASAPVIREYDYSSIGTVELRWSPSCQTGWSRFTPNGTVAPVLADIGVTRPSDSARAYWGTPRYNEDWPFYGPQLNGSSGCIEAWATMNVDGPEGGERADGTTGCGAGPVPTGSYAETTGGPTNTWTDYRTAGGTQGPSIGSNATIYVACKLTGFRVANGNAWWYRLASGPWNNTYYASADAFYNNGRTSGSLAGTPFVDTNVRDC